MPPNASKPIDCDATWPAAAECTQNCQIPDASVSASVLRTAASEPPLPAGCPCSVACPCSARCHCPAGCYAECPCLGRCPCPARCSCAAGATQTSQNVCKCNRTTTQQNDQGKKTRQNFCKCNWTIKEIRLFTVDGYRREISRLFIYIYIYISVYIYIYIYTSINK